MTFEEAKQVANEFRSQNPHARNVRVEKRADGGYRAVFDHFASVGRKAATKKHPVTRRLIAGWGATVATTLWNALERPLSADEAVALRAALEPQLPKRWRFGERWHEGGTVYVLCGGKKTLVTSHCDESRL